MLRVCISSYLYAASEPDEHAAEEHEFRQQEDGQIEDRGAFLLREHDGRSAGPARSDRDQLLFAGEPTDRR